MVEVILAEEKLLPSKLSDEFGRGRCEGGGVRGGIVEGGEGDLGGLWRDEGGLGKGGGIRKGWGGRDEVSGG